MAFFGAARVCQRPSASANRLMTTPTPGRQKLDGLDTVDSPSSVACRNDNVRHNSRLVRVLVADDNPFARTALIRMIESDPVLRVSGTAQSGQETLEKISLLQPDVVTLDVEMQDFDGLETLKRIMRVSPRPVIVVSSLTQNGAEITLDALACGAFDCVRKQLSEVSLDMVKNREDLITKIKAAAKTCWPRPMAQITHTTVKFHTPATDVCPRVIAVGISTGGPQALQQVLPLLPADLAVGVLIVQHMPPGFTGPLARRLDGLCKVTVREAGNHEVIEGGVVYIAPAGQHMTVYRRNASQVLIRLSHLPENSVHMPSVDVMMLSVAEVFQAYSMGIIMTGMGVDGLLGMQAIARNGGTTLGQDESSCTVYGMPRACARSGVLQRVVPLMQIPEEILHATHYRQRGEILR